MSNYNNSPDNNYPIVKSPRRELLGPRPTPLKVRKDSHKIKKPPIPPQPFQPPQQQPPQYHRPPVIIYTVSPKVIHTNPNDFMSLVQKLTGSTTSNSNSTTTISSSSSAITTNTPFNTDYSYNCGAVSPAARYASMEKTKQEGIKQELHHQYHQGVESMMMMDHDNQVVAERTSGFFPGILSPGPTSLPPISPGFFSPLPSDPNSMISMYHDLSPVVHGNRNFMEGSFMPSPSSFNYLISPTTPSFDLFNNFFDF